MTGLKPTAGKLVRAAAAKGATRLVMAGLSRMQYGSVEVTLPDGTRRRFGDRAGPTAHLTVHNADAFRSIAGRGEIGLGEAYVDGHWSSPDLALLLEIGAWNRAALDLNARWLTRPLRWVDRRLHRARRNTVEQSRTNIAAHYDLSNELFALFLDPTMTYSSGLFETGSEALQAAQELKYEALISLAGLQPESHVLEIGGGWGGFAIHAARKVGCRVTSITISAEQWRFMEERIAAEGLADRVEAKLLDYRDVSGQYDAIVSIEMLEAVGADFYERYFEVCQRSLRPGGRIALQVITVPDRAFAPARDGVNWLQKYIFPGGDVPSLAAIERALTRTDLIITSVRDIGTDYATTLRIWRERFLEQRDRVLALGFDERFMRMWEYYLALCEAGFRARMTQDLQIGMERPAPSA